MAEAYATFAANGERNSWYVIQQVSDENGLRMEHKDQPDRAFTPAIASNVSYALQQVVQSGTGQRAQALGRPAGGKTGTATATQANGDQRVVSSWFSGYTPQLSTAVSPDPRRRHQAARRLPGHVLRGGLPDRDVDGVHEGRSRGAADPRVPAAG